VDLDSKFGIVMSELARAYQERETEHELAGLWSRLK